VKAIWSGKSSIDLNAKLPSRSSNFPGEGRAGSEDVKVVDVLVQLILKISLNAICFKFDRKALQIFASEDRGVRAWGAYFA